MKIVGVAGGSGTGKSTVAAHLAAHLGGVHIDADAVVHELLAFDEEVGAAVRSRFGETVFGPDGSVDRRALGAVVFDDPASRRDLEAIVHPVLRRRCGERVVEARKSGVAAVVVDAALLLDSKMPFRFDLMVALRCDEAVRFERIMAKGGWDEEAVRSRLSSQRDIEKSFYKADVVVDTDGQLDAVLAEVDRVVDEALAR